MGFKKVEGRNPPVPRTTTTGGRYSCVLYPFGLTARAVVGDAVSAYTAVYVTRDAPVYSDRKPATGSCTTVWRHVVV